MNVVLRYIVDRLKEPSTWRGLIWIITAVGIVLSEDQKQSIATAGMTLAGLIGVFTSEYNKPTEEQVQEVVEKQEAKTENVLSTSRVARKVKNAKRNKDPDNFFND
jgi:hypothetical protein